MVVDVTDLPPPPEPTPAAAPASARNAAPVLIGVAAVVLVVVAVAAVVFFKQKQDQARYCEVYDRTHAPLGQALKEANAALSTSSRSGVRGAESGLAQSKAALDRMNGLLAERRDAAPGSLRGSWDVLIDGPSSDESLSAKKAKDEAAKAVDDYARDVCGLDGDM